MARRTLLALLLLLVPAASAADLTFVARESGCPGDDTYCYVVQGDMDALEPGTTVNVTFRNEGRGEHELAVALLQDADSGGDTQESAAFFEIEPIGQGEEETGTFTVPDDAEGLYFWCDIAGHEQLGMHAEADFGAQDNGAPVGLWPALAAVAAAAWVARR